MNTETRLDELLSRWQDRRAQGDEITAAELCRDCPELQSEVERRLDALGQMDNLLETQDHFATLAHEASPPVLEAVPGYEWLAS